MSTPPTYSLFFDEPFEPEDLNRLPWPITLCDRDGIVLYKNRCAYQMKPFRVRSKTHRIIREALRDDYLRALAQREIRLFECESISGFCYAVTAPTPDGSMAVFWAVNSFLYYSILQAGAYDEEFARLRDSDRLIHMYAEACAALRNNRDETADEALVRNALRFSRASRHFAQYAEIMLNSARENKTLLLPDDLCRELTEYFAKLVSSLGYRLSFLSDVKTAAAVLPKGMFVSTFLQLMTVTLRLASDSSVQVRLCEFDDWYHFRYYFKPSDILPILKTVTVAELEFVRIVCEHCGWQLLEPCETGTGEYMCSFAVPKPLRIETECREEIMSMEDCFEMARQEASLLTPVK